MISSECCRQTHLRTVHGGEKDFQCPECQQCFGHKGDMTVLMLIVAFECECCCQTHLRTVHGGEKDFQCPECQQCFGHNGAMQVLILLISSVNVVGRSI